MARVESMTNPPTFGAGRKMSYRWPAINGGMSTGGLPTMTLTAGRPGELPVGSQWNLNQTGSPPVSVGALYKGRIALGLVSSVGTGWTGVPNFTINTRPYVMPIQTTKGPVSFQGIDDFWCWSHSAILAFDAMPGAVTGDVGITWGVGTAAQIRSATLPGIELGPTGVGTVGVVVRATNGGPITFSQNISLPADMTEYHRYEIRYLGPTLSAEGQFKFLIDGQLALVLSYGAGTVLGDQNPFGTNLGYTPGVVNQSASASGNVRMYVVPDSVTICCGPTEASLP